MDQNKLTHNPFEDVEAHFTFGDAAAWGLAMSLSMNKCKSSCEIPSLSASSDADLATARYFGWTGHVDTLESLFLAYNELNKLGMLPPTVVDKATPLI